MKNLKIIFDISSEDISCSFLFPENLSKEDKHSISEKTSLFLTNLQTGQLMSFLLHSIVEGGIVSSDKILSDLIIKKIIHNFITESEEKPIVTPSEAFVFKEKQ